MSNNLNTSWSRIVNAINEKNSFAICLSINYTLDTVASATSLYFGLNKIGKNATLACDKEISLSVSLTGADKIQKNINTGGNNLVISFPYTEGSVDKVTYNIEDDYFNLLIQPREGFPKLDPTMVKYFYTGGQVDVIITIDATNFNSLGNLYNLNKDQFQGKEIVNIDRHLTNTNFGTINLVDRHRSSTSELILALLQYLNIEIDKEIATNLYLGLVSATNNFTSYSVSDKTFETAAQLLKLGAVKKPLTSFKKSTFSSNEIRFSQEPFKSSISSNVGSDNFVAPVVKKQPSMVTAEKKERKKETDTPQDWLKPKIFHGSNIV